MKLQNQNAKLITLLETATKLVSEYEGGYSGQFLSAAEFHQALDNSIQKLKQGDKKQLEMLRVWFSPTSCWDDFVGENGQDLANEIFETISVITK